MSVVGPAALKGYFDSGDRPTASEFTDLVDSLVHASAIQAGSWTPQLIGSSTSGAHTYSAQIGRYQRTGNVVTAFFTIGITSKDGAMAGDVRVIGLPQAASVAGAEYAISFGRVSNIDLSNGYSQITGYVAGSEQFARIREAGDNVTDQAVTAGAIANGTVLDGAVLYYV